MSDVAIEFSSLRKVYKIGFWGRRQVALEGLSLKVPEGSIYGFLGANGAGKTTAIKILIGLQFSDSGSCRVFGENAIDSEVKSRIGYMPERPYFHEGMNVSDFLDFHRSLFGSRLSGRKLSSNEELLDLVGLSHVAGKNLRDFSKGMLQRAGIAQALVNNPDLVILDEPMSGLDPIGRKDMRDLILRLSQQGKTVFFSTHILSDVEMVCHRFAFLEKGVLKFEGKVGDILLQANLTREICFTGLSETQVKGAPLLQASTRNQERWYLHCSNEENAREAIELVWALNGKLISFTTEQPTLEEYLFGKGVRG